MSFKIKCQRKFPFKGRTFLLRTLHGKTHKGWWYVFERQGRRVVFHDAADSYKGAKKAARAEV